MAREGVNLQMRKRNIIKRNSGFILACVIAGGASFLGADTVLNELYQRRTMPEPEEETAPVQAETEKPSGNLAETYETDPFTITASGAVLNQVDSETMAAQPEEAGKKRDCPGIRKEQRRHCTTRPGKMKAGRTAAAWRKTGRRTGTAAMTEAGARTMAPEVIQAQETAAMTRDGLRRITAMRIPGRQKIPAVPGRETETVRTVEVPGIPDWEAVLKSSIRVTVPMKKTAAGQTGPAAQGTVPGMPGSSLRMT